jgi:ABC-type dipeptide/oligopeptide/nickel transport system permease component
MIRFVIRRLLLTIPVLLGASLLIYAMVYALPGDPVRALAGDRPLSASVQAQIRADYNLDDSFPVQYGKYLWGLLHGDFGKDFSGRPVLETISQRLPVTVKLTIVAVVFETLFGITAGILASLRRNSFFDNLVLISTTMLVSIPVFVLGFLAQFVFGFKLGWFPIAGIADGWFSYLLPGLVLASLSMAYVARLTRSAMLESFSADYVRTARAKGVGRTRIVLRHVFRNSLIPIVTFIGADIGSLLGGAIVTESVFNLPGLGRAIFDAVRSQQGPVVVGIVTMMVFFYIFFNLIADVLYAVIDPRIRYG